MVRLSFFGKCSFVVIGKTLLCLVFYVFTWISLGSSKSWIYKYTNFVHNNFFKTLQVLNWLTHQALTFPNYWRPFWSSFPWTLMYLILWFWWIWSTLTRRKIWRLLFGPNTKRFAMRLKDGALSCTKKRGNFRFLN